MNRYPGRVRARLDAPGRWLWLVKWLLLIPHFVVLIFLGLGFIVMTLVAYVAILFTGRYPRGIFDFNVGVLRWTWRVTYYGDSALGTDRYPPVSLHSDPTYPAALAIGYPARLSRGPARGERWVLAMPHSLGV